MPRVDVSVVMNAPAHEVWSAVADVLSYPQFMQNVHEVTLLEELADGSTVTSWSVSLKGSRLEWTERDIPDHARRRLDFAQLDGDLEQFEGAWTVTENADGGVTVRLECDFDIGIPLLSDMLNPVAAKALTENSEAMLRQIEAKVAA
ncbi:type II toxin-antitoxin system RatA family toxin [Nakamurella sp. GG22]